MAQGRSARRSLLRNAGLCGRFCKAMATRHLSTGATSLQTAKPQRSAATLGCVSAFARQWQFAGASGAAQAGIVLSPNVLYLNLTSTAYLTRAAGLAPAVEVGAKRLVYWSQ